MICCKTAKCSVQNVVFCKINKAKGRGL
uniref:Uncharacterized protein n=1 Tax=Anguilla anguilla TaxID=7936 RepID=A0A0E9R8L3_ANGAN